MGFGDDTHVTLGRRGAHQKQSLSRRAEYPGNWNGVFNDAPVNPQNTGREGNWSVCSSRKGES